MKEKKLFKNVKNMKKYVIMNTTGHYICDNQKFLNIIIETIKSLLK